MDNIWDGCKGVDVTLARIIRLRALNVSWNKHKQTVCINVYTSIYCYYVCHPSMDD